MRVVVFLLSLLPALAFAGNLSLTWIAPAANTDGSALTNLDGFRVYAGHNQGGPYALLADIHDADANSYSGDVGAGTWYFVSTAYNSDGAESGYSNEVTKTIALPEPAPPQNLTVVETNLIAYGISQTKDRLVTYPVGEVPPGTPCDGSMSANGKYLVPFDAVTWAGTAKPVVVLAECSGG